MTNAEVLALMMQRFGNRSSTSLKATVLIELNQKIRQLERGPSKPWFLEDIWQGQTVANQDYVDLPSDYLIEDDEGEREIRDTNVSPIAWTKLNKTSYGKLRAQTANAEAQIPVAYAIYGEKAYFGPTPDQVYSFRIPYFKRTTEIADNTQAVSNKFLLEFFNYITLTTVDIVARTHTRDNGLVDRISKQLLEAKDEYFREVEARLHAGREYLLDDEEN